MGRWRREEKRERVHNKPAPRPGCCRPSYSCLQDKLLYLTGGTSLRATLEEKMEGIGEERKGEGRKGEGEGEGGRGRERERERGERVHTHVFGTVLE